MLHLDHFPLSPRAVYKYIIFECTYSKGILFICYSFIGEQVFISYLFKLETNIILIYSVYLGDKRKNHDKYVEKRQQP